MALARLLWRIDADTGGFERGVDRAEQRAGQLSQTVGDVRAGIAGWAAAAATALTALDDVLDRAEQIERSLDVAQGGATDEGRRLRDRLLDAGFSPDDAIPAVSAVLGRTDFAAGGREQTAVAATLAQLQRAGGDATQLVQLAQAGGVDDDAAAIIELAQIAFAGAGAQDADLGRILTGATRLAPAAGQIGLSAAQTLQLTLGAERSLIEATELRSPLARVLAAQAETGRSGLDELAAIQARIEAAPSDEAALAEGTLFGARNALPIVQGIRRGELSFRPADLSSAHLAGTAGLGSVEATTAEQLDAIRARGGVAGNLLAGLGAIPLVGSLADASAAATLRLTDGAAPQINVTVTITDDTAAGIRASVDAARDDAAGRTPIGPTGR